MKLDRTTRGLVKVGTVLKDSDLDVIVTNMSYGATGGITVTLMLQTGRLAGHVLYGEPLSHFYGCEMENTAENDRLAQLAKRISTMAGGDMSEIMEGLKTDPIKVVEDLVDIMEEV